MEGMDRFLCICLHFGNVASWKVMAATTWFTVGTEKKTSESDVYESSSEVCLMDILSIESIYITNITNECGQWWGWVSVSK